MSDINLKISHMFTLDYWTNDKVILTNFPTASTPFYTIKENTARFKITPNGLKLSSPSTIPQIIEFKTNTVIATINFNVNDKKLIVNFTGNIPNTNLKDTVYFLFKLRDSFKNIKLNSLIYSNETANTFVNDLNNGIFQMGDIIEIDAFDSTFPIVNFQDIGQITDIGTKMFDMDTKKAFLKITSEGLKTYSTTIPMMTNTLINTIKINKVDDTPFIWLKFNTLDKIIQTFSVKGNGDDSSDYNYFIFKLYDLNNSLIVSSTLPSNSDSNFFTENIKFKKFDINYIIELIYNDISMPHIVITNLQGENHIPVDNKEYYKITANGLESYSPLLNFLPNAFVFKSFDTDKEIAKVQFDKDSKNLVVRSTGVSYNGTNDFTAFSFRLRTGRTVKASSDIRANENANKFKNELNNVDFQYGDNILIVFEDRNKVYLSNYPDLDNNYNPIDKTFQVFIITENGITPKLTPNKITIKAKNDEEVATIEFVEKQPLGQIIVSSKEIIPDPSSIEPYVTLILKDENKENIIKAILNSNENANSFKSNLNGKTFKFVESTLILIYKDKTKIQIFNYPRIGNVYAPNFYADILKISPDRFENFSFNSKVKIINDTNDEVAILYFIKSMSESRSTLIATYTENISTNSIKANEKYLELVQYDLDNVKLYEKILSKETAKNFSNNLNDKLIEVTQIKDIIRVSSRISNRIVISNYKEQAEYTIGIEPEFFTLKNNNLVPRSLNYNKIRFKNKDNSTILYIYFDIIDNSVGYIEVYSTGIINKDCPLFYFKILDQVNITTKLEAKVNSNESGDVINISGDGSNISNNFSLGDILELRYFDRFLVEITDFPNKLTAIYNPIGVKQSFSITERGLAQYIPGDLNSQEIDFKNVAILKFDINKITLKVISLGDVPDPNLKNISYYLFKLRDSSNNIKIFSFIDNDENGDEFSSELNNNSFEYGDIIELNSFAPNKIEVKNFPQQGENKIITTKLFNMETYQTFFKITKQGLQAYNPKVLPETPKLLNIIKFKRVDGKNFINIIFNTLDRVLQSFVFATNADDSSEYDYIIAKLYDKNSNLLNSSVIPSNNLPFIVTSNLNLIKFDYDYILDFTYNYRARPNVVISNLKGREHVPIHSRERYKITKNGLESLPVFLQNIITINSRKNNSTIATIEFNIIDKKLNSISFNNIIDSSISSKYITISLYHLNDSTLTYPIYTATLLSNELPNNFVNNINRFFFNYDCILGISCDESAFKNISITNFMIEGRTHIINKKTEYFKITKVGLESFFPTSNLKNNKITITSRSSYVKNALVISFNETLKKIEAIATDDIISSGSFGRLAFSYKLKNKDGEVKKEGAITAFDSVFAPNSGKAIDLANNLNNTSFEEWDTLELYAPSRDYASVGRVRLLMSYLPLIPNDYYKFKDTETITITPLGLALNSDSPLGEGSFLKNVITLKNSLKTSYEVLQIYFNIKFKKILVSSSAVFTEYNKEDDYFVFILNDKNGAEKVVVRITANKMADVFADALNDVSFEYEDTITMNCINLSKISIMNYPNYGENYSLSTKGEKFIITELGLIPSE